MGVPIQRDRHFYGDLPWNTVVQEIHTNMTCREVLNYAQYVFYRTSEKLRHGSQSYTLAELCNMFDDTPARSIQVKAVCGPPKAKRTRSLTLSELVNDWYWNAKTSKNHHVIKKFQDAMNQRGLIELV